MLLIFFPKVTKVLLSKHLEEFIQLRKNEEKVLNLFLWLEQEGRFSFHLLDTCIYHKEAYCSTQ